jgi:cation transport ATPase
MWQGLFWAIAYNVLGIPLAAFGYLSPLVAGRGVALSSVVVGRRRGIVAALAILRLGVYRILTPTRSYCPIPE